MNRQEVEKLVNELIQDFQDEVKNETRAHENWLNECITATRRSLIAFLDRRLLRLYEKILETCIGSEDTTNESD